MRSRRGLDYEEDMYAKLSGPRKRCHGLNLPR